MPDVWVSRWWIVTGFHASGHGATYTHTESSSLTFPASRSCIISMDVNCFVTEPMRNFVCGELGICHSMLAKP